MKANDDPKNTGTFPFVHKWNINVPIPAENNATDGSNPVNIGTNTVAPNIAIRCCIARITFITPSLTLLFSFNNSPVYCAIKHPPYFLLRRILNSPFSASLDCY